jgi:hypothetical protein
MNAVTKFETGNIYQMNFIGDSELKVNYICTKITKTSATFEKFMNPEIKITKKIRISDSVEYILTDSYSFAPIIRASRIVG